jgi:hypothetical protein
MADEPQTASDRSVDHPTERSLFRRPLVPILAAVTLGSVLVASYFAGQAQALRQAKHDVAEPIGVGNLKLPLIDATAAVTSPKFSMATGFVSEQAEGLFVLDHNSGLLQCSVMYPRLGKFLGMFSTNVHDALGASKGAEYMMLTGLVDIPQSSKNPVATSVIYVLNTSTGMYACYYIPFNRAMMNSNQPQKGLLGLMATGSADPVFDRDSGR